MMVGERPRLGGAVIDVAVEGGAVRVETLGSGPPVVFVHGWTLDRRVWAPQAAALATRFRVVALDRRGFGDSSAPPDLAREPDDLIAVADALGLGRFALVGMSQGGRVALGLAVRYPERVAALVLQGAPFPGSAAEPERLPADDMARLARAGDFAAMRALWRGHPMMQLGGAEANRLLDAIVADYSARDLLTPPHAIALTPDGIARLGVPVLAITGAEEPATRHAAAEWLAATTGGARLNIEGGSHLCNLCHAEAYNAALMRFLDTSLAAA